MGKFRDKVVCITGSDGGIGRVLSKKFAAEGATLILTSIADSPSFEDFVSELKSEYKVEVYPFFFDLTDEEAIKEGLKAIKALKLKIHVLINNAGIPHLAILPFTRMSDVRKVFQVNYFAQLQITQSLLSVIVKDGTGCILNAASIAGIDGDIGNSVYGATKASMILMTKVLSKELASSKIRVNAVAPGLTSTPFADAMGDKAKASMEQISSMGRMATPDEIANTYFFLASDDASFINGQVIRVDGGVK
ncbi:MAG: SDR family oxidoreductase [Bacteroidales bacterium]|nr:SDR family oxidoreductase [Bacteroidales bacterium]